MSPLLEKGCSAASGISSRLENGSDVDRNFFPNRKRSLCRFGILPPPRKWMLCSFRNSLPTRKWSLFETGISSELEKGVSAASEFCCRLEKG
jgi:hypothetical protein